jgi:hypothetical protein
MRGHRDIGARLSTWGEHLETRLYVRDDDVYAEISIRSDDDGASTLYDGRLDALAYYGADAVNVWRDAVALGGPRATPVIPARVAEAMAQRIAGEEERDR